jgi:hypothetical protein
MTEAYYHVSNIHGVVLLQFYEGEDGGCLHLYELADFGLDEINFAPWVSPQLGRTIAVNIMLHLCGSCAMAELWATTIYQTFLATSRLNAVVIRRAQVLETVLRLCADDLENCGSLAHTIRQAPNGATVQKGGE